MTTTNTELAHAFAEICLKAALPVMEVYAQEFTPEQKEDRSPVTEADKRAEVVILEALKDVLPDVPVLAEESFSAGVRPEVSDRFLLVDPVDGTKEFIKKNGEFTINIALIENGVPVAGCVYAPALERLYVGADGAAAAGAAKPGDDFDAASLSPIKVRDGSAPEKIAVMSRSHADEETRKFAEDQGVTETISAGSSLKFCRVAEGAADLYPRFGPTMEWDTGAGHAVVNGAGGKVTRPDGSPFLYGKVDTGYLNGPFVVWAQPKA
ncbi:MAG: 3'(2'),5'-bisphosphate nucleotidase CysQ [Alphaproteobacteria bacterium]|nr:3'(2'),5'-bisphosphate nucleotidase CysQ [Alphaproteobacteria bacterium]